MTKRRWYLNVVLIVKTRSRDLEQRLVSIRLFWLTQITSASKSRSNQKNSPFCPLTLNDTWHTAIKNPTNENTKSMLNHTQNEKTKKLVDSFKYLMFPPRRIEMLPFLQKKKEKKKKNPQPFGTSSEN